MKPLEKDLLSKHFNIIGNKWHITTALVVVVMLLFFVSCHKKNAELINVKFNPQTMPTMNTDSVTTLISDSGVTRYKLVAENWQVFDKAKDPYWFFPEGLYLERYGLSFNVEATIVADTAWNYTVRHLWRLKGNVHVQNMQGDLFDSDELFWDEQQRRVYSDKLISIKKGGTELKGYGFESNQEMDEYRIRRPFDGRIPFDENSSSDVQFSDSIQ